ncbi:hypothetical protein P43SY_002192 [Pythium insidiosum]|uniref:Transmembrane protein n=1 Tax=Pythium insidiosum TaxID=114742 RepID=A0AAD5M927_PYTIN|nr:hypothetical protein P43SY_002192 [Pythium insidiosum]
MSVDQSLEPTVMVPRASASSPRKRRKSVREACRDAVHELEKRAEAARDVVADEINKLEKRAEACRDAVAEEFEKWSLWAYRDQTGEEWDAQPACFITDYLLALQCFGFALYVALYASASSPWYLIYFVALGTSAAFGGLLHHVAFEALQGIADEKKKSLVQTARVFGVHLQRSTVDRMIEIMWRIVLGTSILNNFALLSLAASRHLSEAWAYSIIFGAGACYAALAVWASINMHVLFLMVGFLPAMIFGAVTSVMAFDWQWRSHPSNELLVYVLKLGSGLVQGLVVSPSNSKFNHNALSHVILSVAATFVLVHSQL